MHLGELEKRLIDYIWSYPTSTFTVRDITDAFNTTQNTRYAYNTILTVMTHLYDKKLLTRKKYGKQCIYSVRMSKSAYVKKSSKAIFEKMKKEYGQLAIAHFADLVEDIDPRILEKAKKATRTQS